MHEVEKQRDHPSNDRGLYTNKQIKNGSIFLLNEHVIQKLKEDSFRDSNLKMENQNEPNKNRIKNLSAVEMHLRHAFHIETVCKL